MKKTAMLTAACVLAALAACVPSLYPLYTEKDLIFDPELLGTWTGSNETSWTLRQAERKSYKLIFLDQDMKTGEFSVHLVKLGAHLFLDLYPIESKAKEQNFYRLHWRPMHTFAKITREDDTWKVAYMQRGWISEALKKNPGLIKHEPSDRGILLTAPTADLQKLILDNVNDPKIFHEYATLKRVAGPETKPGDKDAKQSKDDAKSA